MLQCCNGSIAVPRPHRSKCVPAANELNGVKPRTSCSCFISGCSYHIRHWAAVRSKCRLRSYVLGTGAQGPVLLPSVRASNSVNRPERPFAENSRRRPSQSRWIRRRRHVCLECLSRGLPPGRLERVAWNRHGRGAALRPVSVTGDKYSCSPPAAETRALRWTRSR